MVKVTDEIGGVPITRKINGQKKTFQGLDGINNVSIPKNQSSVLLKYQLSEIK